MTEQSAISPKQPSERADALAVLLRLRDAGHVAYFAGGCVRDELLGQHPKDYDVATDAAPQRVRQLFPHTQAVGAAFGVILVRQQKSMVEVATFRAEGRYLDGRRPSEVHFTSAEEDAKRRDFTINGLFLDPVKSEVIDYVGGQGDLKSRRVRAIGNPVTRFEEDHLRMLRAVRIASRLGFTIDVATADAIRAHAQKLARISPERIAEELRLMLLPPTRGVAWSLLWDLELIGTIFRFLPEPFGARLDSNKSMFLAIDPATPKSFGLVLAAATLCYRWHLAGFPDIRLFLERHEIRNSVKAVRQTLRISNDESDEMAEILESFAPLLSSSPPTLAAKKRFKAMPHFAAAQDLLRALASIGEHSDRIRLLLDEISQFSLEQCAPPPLLTGDGLVEMGYAPGPKFKSVLEQLYDAQLEGEIATREQAKSRARELFQ